MHEGDGTPIRALLSPAVRPHRALGVAWIAAIVFSAGAALSLPAVVGLVLDAGASLVSIVGLAAVVAALALGTAARYYTACWFAESVTARLRQHTFDHLLSLDVGVYHHAQPGDLLSRLIADTDLVRTGIALSGTAFLRNSLTALGAAVMLFATSPRLAAIALVAVPLVVAPIALGSRRVRRLSRDNQDRHAQLQAHATEVLGAMPTVQSMARERWESGRFAVVRQSALDTSRRRIATQALLAAAVIGGVGLAITGIVALGAASVRAGEITGGQLGQFLLYAFIAGFSIAALAEVLSEVQRTRGGLSRVQALMGRRPTVQTPPHPVELPAAPAGAIRFDRVSFAYPGRPDAPSLVDISLDIAPGETIAIVGPSGAGKSTLLQLLQRFYDPDQGAVYLDGLDLRSLRLEGLRQALAVVPQHPVLFSGTAAENIRYGRLAATEEQVRDAAIAAEADGFITALPQGYETLVGVRGATLSGGQQQRLAIARALVRHAPVLLLDEATSALDAQSEQSLQRAFDRSRAGRTTIVIAHRLATVQRADRIIVLDRGRIVAQGTHAQLVAQPGLYADLARLQFLPDAPTSMRDLALAS